MNESAFHFAPNVPWLLLVPGALAAVALAVWAYRFRVPPLPAAARGVLPVLRAAALVVVLLLLAQPVLERATAGPARIVALLDRSRSMDLDDRRGESRGARAERALAELRRAWGGRAAVAPLAFAARLEPDTGASVRRGATALGDALAALARSPEGQDAGGVVVLSDGAVNAGEDPVVAARGLGIPVHTVLVGAPAPADRAVTGFEAPPRARAGEPTPVRVRVTSTEPRGTPLRVRVLAEGREAGVRTVAAPGGGAEVVAEFRVTAPRPGLAVWSAAVDSLPGEATPANNARRVAVEVAPGRLGVVIVSGGLNWDLAFLRRALAGDSSLALSTFARGAGGWTRLERGRESGPPGADAVRGAAVVILDAIAAPAVSPAFDRALAEFVRGGGGLLLLGGPAEGLGRYAAGALARDLALATSPARGAPAAAPVPAPDARELLQWDDDPARGDRAWRAAAPLAELRPITGGAGDRVLIGGGDDAPPLMLARRIGRGQAVLVNGTGSWRWSLNPHDDLAAERGRRLWRRLARWLAEPVQGEPLRVRPERWLTAGGEAVRLFATLQDASFQPVAGATVRGEIALDGGATRAVTFEPAAAGSYVATLEGLGPGRHRVAARATRGGAELGRAGAEFAVDTWSVELARPAADSSALAALAGATGGSATDEEKVASWARTLVPAAMVRVRRESSRLWESPWVFAAVVAALGVEWMWRRRRGLP